MHNTKNDKPPRLCWLTKKEKKYWLKRIEEAKQDETIDLEILPYLERINSIDGICTCYSCTGHEKGVVDGKRALGFLDFRLSGGVASIFLEKYYQPFEKIPGIKFISQRIRWEGYDKRRGVYIIFHTAWNPEDWPGVFESIVRLFYEMEAEINS